jgi:hypothetical protein
MGVAYGAYGESRGVYRILVCKPEGKSHLENQGVDGKIILRWIYRRWDVRAWTESSLAQDRDRWRALVNVVMILRFP